MQLKVSIPLAPTRQPVSTSTWKGVYHEDELFVSGIPNSISETEVLAVFAEHGDAEVQMMKNTAIVKYGDKRHAARALNRLHKSFSFPGSTRQIYVRFARKLLNDATSANFQPKHKLTKVA
jgi:RNA recognition motif-containing protein